MDSSQEGLHFGARKNFFMHSHTSDYKLCMQLLKNSHKDVTKMEEIVLVLDEAAAEYEQDDKREAL